MEASKTRLRESDRRELSDKRQALEKRIQVLNDQFAYGRDRLAALRDEEQRLERDVAAASEALEQAQAALKRARLNMETVAESQQKADREVEEVKAELAEVERLIGAGRPTTPTRGVREEEALAVAARFGTFGDGDFAAVLRTSMREAHALLAKLVEAGLVIDTGRKMLGQRMYEAAPTEQQTAAARTEAVQLGRDWICEQTKAFTRLQLKQACELTDEETDSVVEWAMGRDVVRDIGVEGAEILQYFPPSEPGRAAVVDMRRRKERMEAPTARGGPVAGTGKGLTVTDPDTRALVQACERAGAVVEKASAGHLRVSYDGKSVNIASTPSSRRTVLTDRARIRRNLGLNIAT